MNIKSDLLISGKVGNNLLEQQKQLREQVVSRWDDLGFLENLHGHKKDTIAQLFENQASYLINETTTTDSSGSFETVVFPIVRRVFSKLLANDIVSVQALNMPIGKIFYFIPKISIRQADGSHFYPDYYPQSGRTTQFESRSLYDAYYDDNDPLYDRTKGSYTVESGNAATVIFTATSTGNQIMPATITGCKRYVTLQITGFTSSGAGKLIGPNGNEMDSEEFLRSFSVYSYNNIVGCGTNSGTTVFNSNTRLEYRLVTQKYGSGIVEYGTRNTSWIDVCDATGKMYIEIDLSNTACYECDQVDGYVGSLMQTGTTFYSTWRNYQSLENEAALPEVTFDLSSVTIDVTERKLRAQWSPELAQDVNAFQNIDAEAELTSIVSEEVAAEIDREILGDLRVGAAWKLRWNWLGWRTFTQGQAPYTQKEWNQTLITTINQIDAQIYKSTLRSGTKFVVCGPQVSAVFEDMNYFHTSNAAPEQDQYNMGMERMGTLSNKFVVYRDPYFAEKKILIGHKGSSMLDTGYVYAPYVPLMLSPTMINFNTMANIKVVQTRYAKKFINNRFYGLVHVDNLTTFDMREFR